MGNAAYEAQALARSRELVQGFKESNPCADCGNFFPHYVMEFDHVRENRKPRHSVLGYWGPLTLKRLLEVIEIEKVELVCANCHCTRTHKRKQGREYAQ